MPIAAMEHEHDHAGALLAELRRRTGGYVPPDWACQTFRASSFRARCVCQPGRAIEPTIGTGNLVMTPGVHVE